MVVGNPISIMPESFTNFNNMKFKRFSAKNDVFNRVHWDKKLSTPRARAWFRSMLVSKTSKKVGYTQKDFALRNGGWSLANSTFMSSTDRKEGFLDLLTPLGVKNNNQYVASIDELTQSVTKAASVYGIDQIGFTKTNLDWHYSHRFDYNLAEEKPSESVEGLGNCIVIGIAMRHDIVQMYPSATAGVAPGFGYSNNILAIQSLVQYIRQLGYDAVGSLNDTALSIPYAVAAGLGEYGRNGLLINKEYGPRFRIGKIFTNMPVTHSTPVTFGVADLCNNCNKCVTNCPPRAIPSGKPTYKVHNISNITGVKKWTVDGEKCFSFWAAQSTECGICIRVCPFNKNLSNLLHKFYSKFVFLTFLKLKMYKSILFLEKIFKFDQRMGPNQWWDK